MVAVPAVFAYWLVYFFALRSVASTSIITLAICINHLFVSQQAYTGGTNGITDVSRLSFLAPTFLGLYFIILAMTLVIIGSWLLTQSNFGLILRSIKENDNAFLPGL